MKVAIDSAPLKGGHSIRGIGVQTKELIAELKELESKDFTLDVVDFKSTNLSDYDLVHYPYFHPFFLTLPPVKPARKVLVTIDDLIPLIYPQHYPPGIKGKSRFQIQKMRLKYTDGILTISETSKKDICRFLGIKPEKVNVVYLAPKKIFNHINNPNVLKVVKEKYKLPDKFVLYVGDVNYNKNVIGLIEACKLSGISLVIAGKHAKEIENVLNIDHLSGPMDWVRYLFGKPHPEIAHYEVLSKYFRGDKNIIRLGYVSDKDLVCIFNLASVYCQPSFYEGFGLPMLEAFACGTPVVAAKTQVLVELGEGGALFSEPLAKELSRNINVVLKNKKQTSIMVRKALNIAGKFSWEKSAAETLEIYKKMISHGH